MSEDFAPSAGARQAPGESGLAQGIVVAWNALAGTNKVRVRGKVFDNLLSGLGAEGGLVRPNDTVLCARLGNTYAVTNRCDLPGQEQRSLGVTYSQTITLTDATASGVFQRRNGPQVSVYIGSSRRAMVTLSAEILVENNVERVGVQVVGVSSIAAVDWKCLAFSSEVGELQATRTLIFEAADGLNEGLNTFQTMHKTANHLDPPLVGEVQITVQPF
jgi:hypothetical protein